MRLVPEGMDRHQLQRGDAEGLEMRDDRRLRQRLHGAGNRGVEAGPELGQAPDMRLVDHRLGPRTVRALVRVDRRVGRAGDAAGHEARAVRIGVAGELRPVGEGRGQLQRVGVEEEFGGVEAMPGLRLPRPVGAQAVGLAGAEAFDPSVMDGPRAAGEGDARLGARGVEEAELDPAAMFGEHGEVAAGGPAERLGAAFRHGADGHRVISR